MKEFIKQRMKEFIKQLICKHKFTDYEIVYLPCKYDGFVKEYRRYKCKKCGKVVLHEVGSNFT